MKKIQILLLTIIIAFITMSMVLTGPSYIESEIIPISINERGQILCKTRFTQNEMGSYSPMMVEYGFCILTNDSIIEFKTKVLNPDKLNNEDEYYIKLKFWDKIFRTETNIDQLNMINNQILDSNYNFSDVNIDKYKIDRKISTSEFEKQKNISLKQKSQKALKNAHNTTYHSKKMLHIMYDFDDVIIIKNRVDFDDDIEIGAYFNYLIPWTDPNGVEKNIDYDIITVTGVLNLK